MAITTTIAPSQGTQSGMGSTSAASTAGASTSGAGTTGTVQHGVPHPVPAAQATPGKKGKSSKRASMLRINKKMEYGMMALLYLHAKQDRVASVREIAEAHGIPEQLLSKVMQSLKGSQFVSSVYGNHGGYRLTRELSEISLFELSRSVVGPVQLAACLEPGKQTCAAMAGCTIMTPMAYLNQMIVQMFQNTSLEVLLQQHLKAETRADEVKEDAK